MFNRYWRSYPWGLQVFLFITLWFTFFWFGFYLVLTLVPKLTGFSSTVLMSLSASSTPSQVRSSLLAQGVSHLFAFALPGILFASLTHPRLREYLGIRKAGKPIQWVLVTGIMLGLIPVSLWAENWSMAHLHLGKWADDLQAETVKTVGAFLRLHSGVDLFLLVFALAVLPAVGEEIIFRGILLRFMYHRASHPIMPIVFDTPRPARKTTRAMMVPVIATSVLFAAFHMSNPHGLPFIFIGGCALAMIYFLTGSLLCSMWGHLLFNGYQVVTFFFSARDVQTTKLDAAQNLPIIYPLLGLLLFSGCIYLLLRHKTPLPTDWSDNFRGERPVAEPAA